MTYKELFHLALEEFIYREINLMNATEFGISEIKTNSEKYFSELVNEFPIRRLAYDVIDDAESFFWRHYRDYIPGLLVKL